MHKNLYCIFDSDDDGFIEGVFDNEQAANQCFNFHSTYLRNLYFLKIDLTKVEEKFVPIFYDDMWVKLQSKDLFVVLNDTSLHTQLSQL